MKSDGRVLSIVYIFGAVLYSFFGALTMAAGWSPAIWVTYLVSALIFAISVSRTIWKKKPDRP